VASHQRYVVLTPPLWSRSTGCVPPAW